jgi:hypothetical protein
MAIISKPQVIYKGIPVVFTLFKVNLLSNHVVSANSRFSDVSNWKDVYINYVSSEGNQRINVNFDSKDNFQNGVFSASSRARTSFIVDSITIVDLDGEILKISRNNLNTATFDIELYSDSESEEFVLLLEDGANFLLESGEFLVLE